MTNPDITTVNDYHLAVANLAAKLSNEENRVSASHVNDAKKQVLPLCTKEVQSALMR